MLNNATNNNICIDFILNQLWPNFIRKERRFCYIGHTINIAIQAVLYGKDKKGFTVEVIST